MSLLRTRSILRIPALVLAAAAVLPAAAEEIRAIWVTRWDYTEQAHVREILDNIAGHGFNTVLFQVRGNGTVFYESEIEPWAWELSGTNPSTLGTDPGWNPLEFAVEYGHQLGLEIHAYMNTYPGWRGATPPPETTPRQLWLAHPDWFAVDSGLDPMALNGGYVVLSPGIPEVEDYLADIYEEVVADYDVDGIHLDYVRYYGGQYSWDPVSLARFAAAHPGATPETHPAEWEAWRRDQVTSLVREVTARARVLDPRCRVTAATWSNYSSGSTTYGQDARGWLAEGILDVSHPMNYTESVTSHRALTESHVLHAADRFVSSGIGASRLVGSPDAFLAQVRNTRELGAHGVTVFAYSSLFPGHVPNESAAELVAGPFRFPDSPPPPRWLDDPGDDDSTGPRIFNVRTDPDPPQAGRPARVSVDITDVSGVYDDDTGPEGQGVYLRWAVDAAPAGGDVVRMSIDGGGPTFVADETIPVPATGALLAQITAYDDDADTGPADRASRTTAIFTFATAAPGPLYVFDTAIGPSMTLPQYAATDPHGRIWVCDWTEHAVRVFDAEGVAAPFDPVVTGLNAAGDPVEGRYPSGVACDADGIVYVSIDNDYDDPLYAGILRFDSSTGDPLAGIDLAYRPGDCDVDADGNLYVVEKVSDRWHHLSPPGSFASDTAFGPGGEETHINRGLACRDDGARVYIASETDNAVHTWDRTSSSPPHYAPGADLCTVTGASGAVDVDTHGWIFAADSGMNRVRLFDADHDIVQEIQGGTPAFVRPRGVAHTADSEFIFIVPLSASVPVQRWRRAADPFATINNLTTW